jgi:F-type H+-transporting ATPase subunit b
VTLDWTTFILEMVNFLVLVWLLKRFLYKPVLDIIERRRTGIDKTLADARALTADADALRAKYEGRVQDWEAEKQQAIEALGKDIEKERTKRLAAVQTELESERTKAAAATQRQAEEAKAKLEAAALAQGAQFAARLLTAVASAEVEGRLIESFLKDVAGLSAERAAALRASTELDTARGAIVTSAFPLSADAAERIRMALAKVLGRPVEIDFRRDATLRAGLSVAIGAWVLGLNLRDELEGFTRLTSE